MDLTRYVNTFGKAMRQKHGCKVHKVSINAAFTCPNRDATKGIGGCTFCNNASFNVNAQNAPTIDQQLCEGKTVVGRKKNASKFIAYFQAYTSTYGDVALLEQRYEQALRTPDVIGLSIGTRPDCVPDEVLRLLANYQEQGHEVWLELGLQSANDEVLRQVNRGHDVACYKDAIKRAKSFGLQVCTHLIVGLPGETPEASITAAAMATDHASDGLKVHPLHVVKGTQMARQLKKGEIPPLSQDQYVDVVTRIIRQAPDEQTFHRLTGTANEQLLLAPQWCQRKWSVLNAIYHRLAACPAT